MRRVALSRVFCYVVCCFVCLHFLFLGFPLPPPIGGPSLVAELCQFLEIPLSGNEGLLRDSRYSLRGLVVLFRHGERSSVEAGAEGGDCSAAIEEDRRTFDTYQQLIESDLFDDFIRVHPHFAAWRRFPDRWKCAAGQLTAEGALQLSKLGHFLRSRYSTSSLFSEDSRVNVSVIASGYPRTFQSSIAFLSSFIFPLRTQIPQVYINYSNDTFLCVNDRCRCPRALSMRHQFESERANSFLRNSSDEYRKRVKTIFEGMPTTKELDDPFQMIDVMLGKYMCRRLPFPCSRAGPCVSIKLIEEMVADIGDRSRRLWKSTESVTRVLYAAESQAILGYVADASNRLRQYPHSHHVQVFSGHDVTIEPLLRTLGISDFSFPHYASRVIFELFAGPPPHSAYFRLLFNGMDRTKDISFCSSSPCPLSLISPFLNELMPVVKEACKV